MTSKVIDCVTFFNNNFMFELRYKILKDVVDYFVICESNYDHRGNKKNINFQLKNNYDKNKIKYILMKEKFPPKANIWENQAIQRDFMLKNITFADSEDYIFFSDPDEIPKPEILVNFNLKKKYGIFLQKCFNFKLNLFNPYESPWEGTRVAKKKNLKSIDFMRQKIKSKNLRYSFIRIDKEKSIELFGDAGWHFNNVMSPEEISLKLKTFAHSEFSFSHFSDVKVIQDKIKKKIDLFNRGHRYLKIDIDDTFPKYLIENKNLYQKWIL